MEPAMVVSPAAEQAPVLKSGGAFRESLEGFEMRCYEASSTLVDGSGSLSPPTAYLTNGSRGLLTSASQASVATTAAGSGAASGGNNSPRQLARPVLAGRGQAPSTSTTGRPRSAGRAGQTMRATGSTAAASNPVLTGGAGSASSSSRTENSRQSPRRQLAGSRSTSGLAGGLHSGSSSSSRAVGKAAPSTFGSTSRQSTSAVAAGPRGGNGDDIRYSRPNSTGRGSIGVSDVVPSSRAKSPPSSRSETPQDERAVARQRAGSPGPRGTPPGRRRSPGPPQRAPAGRLSERTPSPPPVLQASQPSHVDWCASEAAAATMLPAVAVAADGSPGLSLVDVLGRIASALERGGGDDGPASGAAAAAVVAAAASAVAEAHRPFSSSSSSFATSMQPSSVDHDSGRGSASTLRDRGGDRHASQQEEPWRSGQGGPVSSRGNSAQAGVLPQMLADLEVRMGRAERFLTTSLESSAGVSASEQLLVMQIQALQSRAERLEHEVADLRAQCARRLDAATRDAAASRHDAEEARNEASTLRSEVAELMAQLLQAPLPAAAAPSATIAGTAPRATVLYTADRSNGAMMSSRSDATSTSSLVHSAPVSGRPVQQDAPGDVEAESAATTAMAGQTLLSSGSGFCSDGVDQVQAVPVIQSSAKFVPAPFVASDVSAATVVTVSSTGHARSGPSRNSARAGVPRTVSAPNATAVGTSATSMQQHMH